MYNVVKELVKGGCNILPNGLFVMRPIMCDNARTDPPSCGAIDNCRFCHTAQELVDVTESERKNIAATTDMVRRGEE